MPTAAHTRLFQKDKTCESHLAELSSIKWIPLPLDSQMLLERYHGNDTARSCPPPIEWQQRQRVLKRLSQDNEENTKIQKPSVRFTRTAEVTPPEYRNADA